MHNPGPHQPDPQQSERARPEVADQPKRSIDSDSPSDLHLRYDSGTGELQDPTAFKVFLKRNLPYQQAPTLLLAAIHDRIDQIRKQEGQD